MFVYNINTNICSVWEGDIKMYIKIKNMQRLKLFCFIILFIAIIFIQNKLTYSYDYPKVESIVISNGDSLWNIAKRYKTDEVDTRKFIHIIKEINMLSTSEIFEGQELKIPVHLAKN